MAIHKDMKPCPFCGLSNIVVFQEAICDWHATCNDCGSTNPFNRDHDEAIRAWNCRPRRQDQPKKGGGE